jgi:conjugative transfer region protein TrbK
MKVGIMLAATVAIASAGMVAASAQSVDDLLKDHALLRSELDRCKQLGMASNDDAHCKTARAAEQKRFFGSGSSNYTQQPVDIFNGTGKFDPQPNSQKPKPPSN